jgi:hypothetical protein
MGRDPAFASGRWQRMSSAGVCAAACGMEGRAPGRIRVDGVAAFRLRVAVADESAGGVLQQHGLRACVRLGGLLGLAFAVTALEQHVQRGLVERLAAPGEVAVPGVVEASHQDLLRACFTSAVPAMEEQATRGECTAVVSRHGRLSCTWWGLAFQLSSGS